MTSQRIAPLAAALLLAAGCGGGGGPTDAGRAVGGTVTGLRGTGLALRLVGAGSTQHALDVAADGSFQFANRMPVGAEWTILVVTQPVGPKQTCRVTPDHGVIAVMDVAVTVTCTTDAFTVGGTASLLAGSSVTLQNSGGDDLVVGAPGAFTFATPVASGQPFAVTVLRQPTTPPQTCTVTGGSGVMGSAAVVGVQVSCLPDVNERPVQGTVAGLVGATPLVLQVNGTWEQAITSDGGFSIVTGLPAGASFEVTVKTEPTLPWQACAVANGSGLMGATSAGGVAVTCSIRSFAVGGTVTGLLRPGLTLRNNGGAPIAVDADGSYAFQVQSLQPWLIEVVTSPPTQVCVVDPARAVGEVAGAAVADVAVTCACAPSLTDCNGLPADGCEADLLGDPRNCGVCGTVCGLPNGLTSCNSGVCELVGCQGDFQNCDGNPANGCEVDTLTDPNNCLGCRSVCSFQNAAATCSATPPLGCAMGSCSVGYGDCNATPLDGCETDLSSAVAHCGRCGQACALPNATAACLASQCAIGGCQPGFANCDGAAANGCEVNLDGDPLHCGSCTTSCTSAPNTAATCVDRVCGQGGCLPGFTDCNGQAVDGCEVATGTDEANCGGCGPAFTCNLAHVSTQLCSQGQCGTAFCDAGWRDCDGAPANGCELPVVEDPLNCGGCGSVCASDRVCSAGACVLPTSCKALLLSGRSQGDGLYAIDPDGAGAGGPIQVWCDMTFDRGGWTFFAHVNGDYQAGALFTANTGTYDANRGDGDATYGLGATVYQRIGATELMVSVINPDPNVTLGSSLVFYSITSNSGAFMTGPVPCDPTDPNLQFRTLLGGYTNGMFGACDTELWYPYTGDPFGAGLPLVMLNGSGPPGVGTIWGVGAGAVIVPPATGDNLQNVDSWWYAR